MATSAISELDLHAYADGQLDAARRSEVEAYLAAHPDAAMRVSDYRIQMQLLHAGIDGVKNEPVPMRLTQALEIRSLPQLKYLAAVCDRLTLSARHAAHTQSDVGFKLLDENV